MGDVDFTWGGRLQLTLVLVSLSLLSMNMFPYLVYANGGVAYFILLLIPIIIFGIPTIYLQILIGQFTRSGPYGIWKGFPAGRCMGIVLFLLVFICFSQYTMFFSRPFVYLFYVFASHDTNPITGLTDYPWMHCANEWNSASCFDANSDSANATPTTTPSYEDYVNRIHPAHEFYQIVYDFSYGLNVGDVSAIVLAWIFVTAPLVLGPRSFLFSLFVVVPIILGTELLVLFRAVSLPGAFEGLRYEFFPDWKGRVFADPVFYLNPILWWFGGSFGCLYIIGKRTSSSRFVVAEVIIAVAFTIAVNVINCVKAGALIGYFAQSQDKAIEQVHDSHMAFSLVPVSLASVPAPRFWLFLHFVHHIFLFVPALSLSLETLATTLHEVFPRLGSRTTFPNSLVVPVGVGFVGFLLDLVMIHFGQSRFMYVLSPMEMLLDNFAVAFLVVVITSVVAVSVSRVVNARGADLASFAASQGGAAFAGIRRKFVLGLVVFAFVMAFVFQLLFLVQLDNLWRIYVIYDVNKDGGTAYYVIGLTIFIVVVCFVSLIGQLIFSLVTKRQQCCPTMGWNGGTIGDEFVAGKNDVAMGNVIGDEKEMLAGMPS